jgi:hypothetical protein
LSNRLRKKTRIKVTVIDFISFLLASHPATFRRQSTRDGMVCNPKPRRTSNIEMEREAGFSFSLQAPFFLRILDETILGGYRPMFFREDNKVGPFCGIDP